jgi:small subunit ribosomal protein S1
MVDATKPAQSNMDNNFPELLKEYFYNKAAETSIVEGIVQEITSTHIIVDVGLKSEGFIDIKELENDADAKNIKIGDSLEVFLESYESGDGSLKLSRSRVLQEKTWQEIKAKYENDEVVEGEINGRVKGGFTVALGHLTAFLPGSQVDVRPIKDITILTNHQEQFKVLKMDELRGNVVVSRRAILEESHKKAVDKILSGIEEGQTLEGIVKNITNYGAFIDLGTIDGLIHIADISWSRITHPSEVLSLGQKIKVKVIKYDPEKRQVSLGLKQLEHDPWADISRSLDEGKKIPGKITNITDYGVFVELQKGIEGLVHLSEMTWSKSNLNPIKDVSLGQEVEVVILEIDRDKHRISLSIKRCVTSPWEPFSATHKVGDVVKGKIVSFTEYGFYLNISTDIDGLVHFSDLAWSGDVKKEADKYKEGQEVEVKILELNTEKERLSLGIKQLENDPFSSIIKDIEKNSRITCTVSAIKNDGIEVSTVEGFNVFIKKIDLAKDKSDQRTDRFAVGERVDAKVIKLDKDSRKISLSIRALEIQEEKDAIKEYGSTTSGASLGDILGSALDATAIDKSKNEDN